MNKVLLALAPAALMLAVCVGMTGVEGWLAGFATSEGARLVLGRAGLALPYAAAGLAGVIFLFAAAGAHAIRAAGWSVAGAAAVVIAIAVTRETARLIALADRVPTGRTALSYADPGTAVGATLALICGVFALRVAIRGNAAFAAAAPRRIRGKRAIHGETDWMGMESAGRLFPEAGGIVIGERYRVDRDHIA
ncbi:conjugal transfer protein TraG, partial [Mesorhizobium sp. M5C.F.Ca.IN.020.29.1.1]